MNIISKKSVVMSLALAGLIMGSTPAKALTLPEVTAKKAVISFLLGSLLVTCFKESVANPEEVDWVDSLEKAAQVQDILTPEYKENLIHMFWNGFLGQIGKNEAILSIPNEDGSVTHVATKPKPSTGICGTTVFFAKTLAKRAKDLGDLFALPAGLITLWNNAEKIMNGNFSKPETSK
jgi:hypothetical protein